MSGETEGGLTVSDRLRDLELGFATLSATLTTKIDGIAEAIKSDGNRHDDHEARIRALEAVKTDSTGHDDHERRIRALEMKVWVACGAALAGGSVLGTLGGFLVGA